jgi:hypothetical protein
MQPDSTDNANPIQKRKRGFQPGQSGNPSGKPKGTKTNATALVDRLMTGNKRDLTAIIEQVIKLAKSGESWAAKEVLSHLPPPMKSRLVKFQLPPFETIMDAVKSLEAVHQACAAGLLTIDEAVVFSTLVERKVKILEASESEARLAAIEAANAAK